MNIDILKIFLIVAVIAYYYMVFAAIISGAIERKSTFWFSLLIPFAGLFILIKNQYDEMK